MKVWLESWKANKQAKEHIMISNKHALLQQVANIIGTEDKNIVISYILKTLVESGMPVNVAYDAIFGDGSYRKMAGNVYDALQNGMHS